MARILILSTNIADVKYFTHSLFSLTSKNTLLFIYLLILGSRNIYHKFEKTYTILVLRHQLQSFDLRKLLSVLNFAISLLVLGVLVVKCNARDSLRILIPKQSKATLFLLECTILRFLKVHHEASSSCAILCTCFVFPRDRRNPSTKGRIQCCCEATLRIHVSRTSPQLPFRVLLLTVNLNFNFGPKPRAINLAKTFENLKSE